jgi:hypothetical protein
LRSNPDASSFGNQEMTKGKSEINGKMSADEI